MPQIEIRPHPMTQPLHPFYQPRLVGQLWLAIVTASGKCYSCPVVGPRPTESRVQELWQEERDSFWSHEEEV
jgi:hypothetical protein